MPIFNYLSIVGLVLSLWYKILLHLLPDGLDDMGNFVLDVVMKAVHLAQDLVPFFQVKGLVSPAHSD